MDTGYRVAPAIELSGQDGAMRIHIAADHAGYELKKVLTHHLRAAGYDVTDHGAHHYDPVDDYPPFCIAAGQAVIAEPGSLGVIVGGSGNGEQMAANIVPGVRAALVWNEDTAVLSRAHNDANVAALGARQHTEAEAISLVETFLAEPFSHAERHQRRIDEMTSFEQR